MKRIHVVGLVLWRGGLLMVAGYVSYVAVRAVLSITDAWLEVAIAILLTGVFFVFLSVLGERIQDEREKRSHGE